MRLFEIMFPLLQPVMCWGTGGGKTSSRSGPPGWLMDPVKKANTIGGLLQPGDSRNSSFSQLLMDPAAFQSIGPELQKYASGQYLDVTNNPAVKNYTDAVTQASGRMAAENQAGIRSRFAQAGQSATGASDPLLQAQENAQNIQAQTLQESLAGPLLNLFSTEQGRQLQALGALGQYEQAPMDMFRNMATMWNQGSTSTPGTGWAYNVFGK